MNIIIFNKIIITNSNLKKISETIVHFLLYTIYMFRIHKIHLFK